MKSLNIILLITLICFTTCFAVFVANIVTVFGLGIIPLIGFPVIAASVMLLSGVGNLWGKVRGVYCEW